MDDEKMERKRLIEYLPQLMQGFAEMKEIMSAEDKEIDRIEANVQRALDNAFIEDCDEYGIRKYETLLGIMPSTEDTLESRKSKVLIRWNAYVPYTYKVLVRKLDLICGADRYAISGNSEDYHLCFSTSLELFGEVRELEKLFENVLPANLYYEAKNMIVCESSGLALGSGGVCAAEMFCVHADMQEM
ncbi:putative phage tail protein [Lachnospiraceae bacterium 46-15]